MWLQEQKLDDEEADLSLVALVMPERHAEHESVQCDHVELPDHAVHGVDALVDVAPAPGLAELMDKEVAEAAEVRGQLLGSYPLQDL